MIKYSDKSNLRLKNALAHNFGKQFLVRGKSWWQEAEASGLTASAVKKQRSVDICVQLTFFSYSPAFLPGEISPPTVGVSLKLI